MLNFQNSNFENFENPVRARKVFFEHSEHFFLFYKLNHSESKKICVKKNLVQKFQSYHGKKVKILKIAQNTIFLWIEQFWVKKNFFVKKKFLIPNCKILGILKTPHGPKNDFFEKMKKLPGDILLRNSETQNYPHRTNHLARICVQNPL